MGEVERCSPTRVLLTHEELVNLDKSQLQQQWMKQENYINWLESQLSTAQNGWLIFYIHTNFYGSLFVSFI
jgi:hypothetical protein